MPTDDTRAPGGQIVTENPEARALAREQLDAIRAQVCVKALTGSCLPAREELAPRTVVSRAARSLTIDVDVALPSDLREPFHLHERGSGMRVSVRSKNAAAASAQEADGYSVYSRALGQAAVILRRMRSGVEDFAYFPEAPASPELTYEVDLDSSVAGLRLVDNSLELLDATGTPRLRAAPPTVRDASGVEHPATLEIEGCAVDSNPAAPWGRPIVPPAAASCVVKVRWDAGIRYPALVDPAWTSTGSMAVGRYWHSANLLTNGRVLVAGGGTLTSAELYDPTTKTWAATGSLNAGRYFHRATTLSDGRVLASGGHDPNYGDIQLTSAEAYNPTTGLWSYTGSMSEGRAYHSSVPLADGRVLVAGGGDSSGGNKRSSAEVYSAATGAWSKVGAMSEARRAFAATVLKNGKVLASGSMSPYALSTAELFDPVANLWTPTGALTSARGWHTLTVLADGKVLAIGGEGTPGQYLSSLEAYDPATGKWTSGPSLAKGREHHGAVLLGVQKVLVVGGFGGGAAPAIDTSELYDPVTNAWQPAGTLTTARWGFSTTLLASGEVLVAGGNAPGALSSAELFGLITGNGACAVPGECLSGFCVDGVCCDQPCTGTCKACSAAKKGTGNDGACGFVVQGADPDGNCLDDGSPACKLNGQCDGSGGCQNYSVATGCVPFPCTSGTECTSGFCADGVCCDKACVGPCDACTAAKKGTGVDGVCGPAAAGTDPRDSCPVDPGFPSSCKSDGNCDGAGACRKFAVTSTACGATSCSASLLSGSFCDGTGTCVSGGLSCAPYACKDALTCGSACMTNVDCSPSAYCAAGGQCVLKGDLGALCQSSVACSSGFCTDGVCCNVACSGQCERCDGVKPGTCSAHTGSPAGGRAPCAGTGTTCGGTCDGVTPSVCTYGTVACGVPVCSDGIEFVSNCDGKGACGSPVSHKCVKFACSTAGTCKQSCDVDADCAPQFKCDVAKHDCTPAIGECDGDHTLILPEGTEDCSPYRCTPDGTCRETCVSAADCIPGNQCDSSGACVPARKPASADDGGCSVSGPPRGGRRPWRAGLILLLAAALMRRGTKRVCVWQPRSLRQVLSQGLAGLVPQVRRPLESRRSAVDARGIDARGGVRSARTPP